MKTSTYTSKLFWVILVSCVGIATNAQVQVDVNIDVNHQVGGETSFNRSKWINVHSSQSSSVWNGDMDKFKYLVDDLDVYFGRETGHIKSSAKRVNQDPSRPGYADPNHLKILGDADKVSYANKTDRHAYEKGNFIVANQQLPLFPNGNNPTDGGWYYASTDNALEPFGTASGEFCADYFNNYFGSGGISGFPMPKYFEIMNEPVWHFVDGNHDGGGTIEQVFKFHKTVADIIHNKVPGLQVGGFGTAFPDFDEGGDLQEWEERWKVFIRDYGSAFDFYTIHLYDRPIQNGKEIEQFRKGGRNEATFDMMEHYSMLQYNEVKPFFITEYGGQLWGMSDKEKLWRPHNDWRRIEAFNAMLMQFLERPNVFVGAIPFVMPKGEWGYDSVKDIPYRCRLLRKANEPESYSGEWVWTEYIKFYELWSDVKGLRLDTHVNHLDFQVDAYAYGKEVYVILNNIESATIDFNLNLKGLNTNEIEFIEVKRLYFTDDEQVMLTKNIYNSLDQIQQIKDDETIIAKYVFKKEVVVDKTSLEEKYYATTYKQPIVANNAVNFTFKNINKGSNGEAVLRLGLARELFLNRFPTSIKVNGTSIDIPDNYRGDLQRGRNQFFGMLEIKVPFDFINSGNNQVEIIYGETKGYITSAALQVFNFSREIKRTEENNAMVTGEVELNSKLGVYPVPAEKKVIITGDLKNWEIRSVEGKLLQKGKHKEVNIEALEAGVYFITLNKTVTKKIIKI